MKKLLSALLGIFGLFIVPAYAALPTGYTELEYIEETGTQYIDTGYFFTDIATETVTLDFMRTGTGAGSMLYGTRKAYKDNGYGIQFQDGGNTYIQYGENDYGIGDTAPGALNTRYTLIQTGPTYSFRDASYTSTGATPTQSYPLYLFTTNNGGNPSALTPMRVYSFVIKDRNNSIKLHLVPAKNSSGVVGMYDTVSGQFFTNQGTGEFIAGDPVTTCDGTVVNYTSATGTGVQNGTPMPTNPIEPTFYKQGNMILRKVGDYADSYDASTGKITRRVGKYAITGNEDWVYLSSSKKVFTVMVSDALLWKSQSGCLSNAFACTNGIPSNFNLTALYLHDSVSRLYMGFPEYDNNVNGFKQWLRDQYAAGTPVTLYYPLAEPVEEDWTETSYCETPIKIATTKYNETAFGPLNTALANAISVVDSVVSNTITQAASIATLQAQKQTRPNDIADDSEKCPAGKKCLLVEDASGIPHWYEIFDPIHEWYDAWVTAGKPAAKGTQTDGKWTFYNAFYRGDKTWRKTYVDGTTSTYDRPFDHATRCTNPSYNTETQKASPCYSEVGMFKTLGDGEWAEVYTSDDGTNSPVGVVYGTSKCTSVAGPTNYTGGGTLLSQLSAADQAKWAELPALHGQPEREGYDSESFKQCWCKMTAVGVPGADGNPANGSIYPVGSSSWVFNDPYGSAAICANLCAYVCAYHVRDVQGFRSVLFGM